jgi:P27 family predicted phage terminase small subunit
MTEPKSIAPRHLRAKTRAWWSMVVATYQLESHHERLLTLACEAWDVGQLATERISADGLWVTDRFGAVKPHPAVAIQRDARLGFARLIRELNLDADEPAGLPHPPTIKGRYR